MKTDRPRPWWLRKRLWLPALALLISAGTLTVAILRSDTSRIMVYNETGAPLGALRLAACGQAVVVPGLGEEESYRWGLAHTGQAGEITIEAASDPPWRWQGGFVEPQRGYRITLRLWPEGEVEVHTQISIWQRLVQGVPDIHD